MNETLTAGHDGRRPGIGSIRRKLASALDADADLEISLVLVTSPYSCLGILPAGELSSSWLAVAQAL